MFVWWFSLCHVWLFATPWTVACQAPLSMGFSRREHWGGLPFPSPEDLPGPGIKLGAPVLQADFFTDWAMREVCVEGGKAKGIEGKVPGSLLTPCPSSSVANLFLKAPAEALPPPCPSPSDDKGEHFLPPLYTISWTRLLLSVPILTTRLRITVFLLHKFQLPPLQRCIGTRDHFLILFFWSVVELQWCDNFCYIAKWFSYPWASSFSYPSPLWFIRGYWI